MYPISSLQEQENSLDVVTGIIKVFTFYVELLFYIGASLYLLTSYIAMDLDILLEQLLEPFSISTPIG